MLLSEMPGRLLADIQAGGFNPSWDKPIMLILWRGIRLNYWVSNSLSKLFSKSFLAWCNSIELLKIILKILLRWILLKGHVPTSLIVLMENIFQKDFEKDFQNFNRIAKVKNMFLKMNFKKIFKMIFNNSIEFLSSSAGWARGFHGGVLSRWGGVLKCLV